MFAVYSCEVPVPLLFIFAAELSPGGRTRRSHRLELLQVDGKFRLHLRLFVLVAVLIGDGHRTVGAPVDLRNDVRRPDVFQIIPHLHLAEVDLFGDRVDVEKQRALRRPEAVLPLAEVLGRPADAHVSGENAHLDYRAGNGSWVTGSNGLNGSLTLFWMGYMGHGSRFGDLT